MTKPFNGIPDYRQKADKVEPDKVPLKACLICQKMTQGYGVWLDGTTCSKTCEQIKEAMPRDFGEPHEKTDG